MHFDVYEWVLYEGVYYLDYSDAAPLTYMHLEWDTAVPVLCYLHFNSMNKHNTIEIELHYIAVQNEQLSLFNKQPTTPDVPLLRADSMSKWAIEEQEHFHH